MPPRSTPGSSLGPTVLQVLPALVTGGVERGTIEITEALTAAGWGAVVASAGGRLVKAVERAGGRHVTLKLASRNPVTMWRNIARLEALIAAERVALVHARSRAPAWSAWAAARRAGVPFVTTYHGVYNEDLPGKRFYNSVMARGAVVIAASRFVAAHVAARHGVDPGRIRVIPRGVDPERFSPDAVSGARVARLAAEWRLPEGMPEGMPEGLPEGRPEGGADGMPVVMLPGRLTGWKGQAVLVAALSLLPGVMGVLVGSDQGRHRYRARLLRLAALLGVSARLRLVGECADMPAALALADVVVHASVRPEAFGRVVIEAQAMGRPVIAADLGGPAETVTEGVTGWRVPPADAVALAGAIRAVLALPAAERAAVGAAARAAVLAGATVAGMQAATLAVYREVLGLDGVAPAG